VLTQTDVAVAGGGRGGRGGGEQFVHWVVDEVCGRQPDWTKPFGEANAQPMIDAVRLFVVKAVGGGLKKDDVRASCDLTQALSLSLSLRIRLWHMMCMLIRA
jgi:hypothetical protein